MALHPAPDSDGLLGFDALYGLELTECSDEVARGRVRVNDELRAPGGVVHGGVYGALSDGLAVRGTTAGASSDGKLVIGLANQTTVHHPIERGTLHATATRRHRGRTTWVWEIEIVDDAGRRCVTGRVTVAVRDAQ